MASILRRTNFATAAILLALLALRTSALPSSTPSQTLQPRQDPAQSSCVFTNDQGSSADFTITIRNRASVVDAGNSLGSGLPQQLTACSQGVVDVRTGLGLTYFATFTAPTDDASVGCIERAIATVEGQTVVCEAEP